MKLSVLIPVYNERPWLEKIVERVLSQNIPGIKSMELIIVDDGSADGTREIVLDLSRKFPDRIVAVYHQENLGKGAAVKTAVEKMSGDVCIIQDADLEYDPAEYGLVLEPILSGRADCVYGSRFIGTQAKRVLFFWHYVGNRVVTLLCNLLTNLNFTDIETCYKAFRADIIKNIPIRSKDFGFEPEITVKIAKTKCRIYEVGISYSGRTYQEGKKVKWTDGLKAIFVILKYWLINDTGKE